MDDNRSRKGLETLRLSPRSRIMPSTNPIRPPTPDPQARVETIFSTASPLRKTEQRKRPMKNTPNNSYYQDDDYLRELIEKNSELQKANENLLRDLRNLQHAKKSTYQEDPNNYSKIQEKESIIRDLQKENYDLKRSSNFKSGNIHPTDKGKETERWKRAYDNLEFKYNENLTDSEVMKKEIDQLRNRLKQREYENEKSLMKSSRDPEIYQLETRFQILQEEIDNLKSILRSKDQTIQNLKEELVEKSNYNPANTSELKQVLNENRNLKNQLANNESNQQNEIQRLNSQIRDSKRKMEDFDHSERDALLHELNFYRDSKSDLDNNLRDLYSELERLSSQLAFANTEKAKVNTLLADRDEQLALASSEIGRLRNQISNLQNELEDAKIKISRANNNGEMRISQFVEQNNRLKEEHSKLQRENKELNNEILNCTTQAQNRISSLEKRHLDELDDLKYQIRSLLQNTKSLESQTWATEREIYEKTIKQLKNKIEELQNNCNYYSEELEKIKLEISQYINKPNQNQSQNDSNVSRNQILNLKEEIAHLKKIIVDLEDKVSHQHDIIKNLEYHLQEIRNALEENKKERDRLLSEYNGKSYDSQFYNEFKEKTFILTADMDRISKERDNYKSQAQISSQEVISMNRTLLEKLREMDMLKNTFIDTLRSIQMVEERLNNQY